MRGVIIGAPASGSGKTTFTLGALRAFRARGLRVASAKVGPDYIDPAYHTAASGRACLNLDTWAMSPSLLSAQIHSLSDSETVIAEGAMGLFDGAPDGRGSAADLARLTGWPVVLVVDASGMAASVAALVQGFRAFDPKVAVSGVVFNRVGSVRHAELLAKACAPLGIPVLGHLPRTPVLGLPERHLGLVQAAEHPQLGQFLAGVAAVVEKSVDLERLAATARPCRLPAAEWTQALPAPGRRIALARDAAFAFSYPYVLAGWREGGAEVLPFSPLADEPPDPGCDAVYLPGGYPELHAERLAAAHRFKSGVHDAAARGAVVYGECGGYMTLGRGLVDAGGNRHEMCGLLPLETSFAERALHLGYRQVATRSNSFLGLPGTEYRGHEFHFAATLGEDRSCGRLFESRDASGALLGPSGLVRGNVTGSFVHLIERCR